MQNMGAKNPHFDKTGGKANNNILWLKFAPVC